MVDTTGHSLSGHTPPALGSDSSRALKITAWLTGIYFFVELGIGIYTGSVAVLSDAFHTFSAVGGILLALVAATIAGRPASFQRTFGYLRAEVIGALLNGVFLFGMALFILYMGFNRLRSPVDVPTTPMLVAAIGGLITEIISIRLLYKDQQGSINVKGAYWHVLQTFVGSLIILLAVVVIRLTGFVEIDPILGMLFGLVLIYASWGIVKEALDILIEAVPAGIDVQEIGNKLQAIPGVTDVHHIHAWSLTSGKNAFSTHLKVDDLTHSETILTAAHDMLKNEFDFYFSTVQIESHCLTIQEDLEIDVINLLETGN